MESFVVLPQKIKGNKIEVKDKDTLKHMRNVLRLGVGNNVRIVDGNYEYASVIESITNSLAILKVLEKKADVYTPKLELVAAISLLKNHNMSIVVKKLTEIGVAKIIPLITKRTVSIVNEKKERWDKLSEEALKQCQAVKFVKIDDPIHISKLELSGYDMVIVPFENERELKLVAHIHELKNKKNIKRAMYIIGPEGGFAEEEISLLNEKGAVSVTLGRRILRAETAAIIVGGIMINEFE